MKRYLFVQDNAQLDKLLDTAPGWGILFRDGTHAVIEAHHIGIEVALQPILIKKVPHLAAGAALFSASLPAALKAKLSAIIGAVTVYDLLSGLIGSDFST